MLSAVMFSVANAEGKSNATSTSAKEAVRENATSTEAKTKGQVVAEEHRSTVATFVKSLLSVANIEGSDGIGPQVRVVAQAQNDSASTTADVVIKIENRSALKTFFIGSDYKNLGQLRSEVVTTQNNIDQLNNLITKAKYNMDKTELTAQIKTLEDSQAKIKSFIKDHESSFSLFGWFVKLFAK